MDTAAATGDVFSDGWTFYFLSFLMLVVLYFIQKYAFLIDRKLNLMDKTGNNWEGKPWPLVFALMLGMFILLYNVFSPRGMQPNPADWRWPEWGLVFSSLILLTLLAYESFSRFGKRIGLIRFVIFVLLSAGFFFGGLYAGLLIVLLLAFLMLVYFIRFWRRRMMIN